jgi:flagellar biosynthesis component FlhA
MTNDHDPSADSLELKAWAVYGRVLDLALGAGQDDVAALELGLRAADSLINMRVVRPPRSTTNSEGVPRAVGLGIGDPRIALRVGVDHADIGALARGVQDRVADEYGVVTPQIVLDVDEDLDASAVQVVLAGDLVEDAVVAPGEEAAALLERVLVHHLAEFLMREEVAELLDVARQESPMVVQELVPNMLALGQLRQVLQNLVKEQVPIKDLSTILNALADNAVYTKDPHALTEHVRVALGRKICGRYQSPDGTLKAFMLSPDAERAIQNAIQLNETGQVLMLDPNTRQAIQENLADALGEFHGQIIDPVLMTLPKIRRHVNALLERNFERLVVLSHSEIVAGVQIDNLKTIAPNRLGIPPPAIGPDAPRPPVGDIEDADGWNW